ncbi:hypothetical protein [uncultured Alcanivorax sp.]|jgi:hypothetical protein|uniref:hypothetical protein n=1 Tax=uncultured Alcanivorax sp. TaxID=191215 RepID=UPI00261F1543|nr:hypothetical protein [uncultured Alcanivorax sp.]
MTSRQRSSGQGGIPNVGMVSGGEITHINLEHVWVEAWIDYHPSRGAKHSVGDSWVPMDASFKQYEYTEGMALEEQVPLRCRRSGSDHLSAKHHQRRGRLAARLPYQLMTRKLVASELPHNLRWRFRYQLYTNQFGRQSLRGPLFP